MKCPPIEVGSRSGYVPLGSKKKNYGKPSLTKKMEVKDYLNERAIEDGHVLYFKNSPFPLDGLVDELAQVITAYDEIDTFVIDPGLDLSYSVLLRFLGGIQRPFKHLIIVKMAMNELFVNCLLAGGLIRPGLETLKIDNSGVYQQFPGEVAGLIPLFKKMTNTQTWVRTIELYGLPDTSLGFSRYCARNPLLEVMRLDETWINPDSLLLPRHGLRSLSFSHRGLLDGGERIHEDRPPEEVEPTKLKEQLLERGGRLEELSVLSSSEHGYGGCLKFYGACLSGLPELRSLHIDVFVDELSGEALEMFCGSVKEAKNLKLLSITDEYLYECPSDVGRLMRALPFGATMVIKDSDPEVNEAIRHSTTIRCLMEARSQGKWREGLPVDLSLLLFDMLI